VQCKEGNSCWVEYPTNQGRNQLILFAGENDSVAVVSRGQLPGCPFVFAGLYASELLKPVFSEPYPIQRIQLAEVGWESDNKLYGRERRWMVCAKTWATFTVLV